MKRRSFAKKVFAVITLLTFMMTFTSQVSLASSGAIWTTDEHENVNVNQYQTRMAVFLNGGPTNNNGGDNLEDGNYYIQVTTPNGELLGYSPNTVKVVNGKFPSSINLWDFLLKATDNTKGYDFTTNLGGVYKVWASLDKDFKNSDSKTDNFTVLEISQPKINLEKTADKSVALVGDTITYSYVVTNTGNVALTKLTLSDDKLGEISLSGTNVAVGATVTGFATYKVVQGDLPGPIKNTATVTGHYGDQTVGATDSVEVPLQRTPEASISLKKTADKSVAQVGDTITYSYLVTNTGNVELTKLKLSDDKLGDISVSGTNVAAGATVTGVATYKVVQGDLPGPIKNTATVTGHYGDQTVTATDSVEVPLQTTPIAKISVAKAANKTTAKEGEEVTYTYTVTNLGNVELTNVTVSDDKLGNITLNGTTLAVDASVTGSVKYVVKNSDFPGPLVNTAVAKGTYAENKTVTATDSFEITLTKDQENTNGGSTSDPQQPVPATSSEDKKELPVTGGNPYAYLSIGMIVLGLGLIMRKRLG